MPIEKQTTAAPEASVEKGTSVTSEASPSKQSMKRARQNVARAAAVVEKHAADEVHSPAVFCAPCPAAALCSHTHFKPDTLSMKGARI